MKLRLLVVETITTLHTDVEWSVLENVEEIDFEMLENFDQHFVTNNIEASLQYALPIVKARLETKHYDVLVVYSKGVALASLLVSTGIWGGATLLLSPIPNCCSHLLTQNEDCNDLSDDNADLSDDNRDRELAIYENLWAGILRIFEGSQCCICYGDSSDEKIMIEHYISSAQNLIQVRVCGSHDWVTDKRAHSIIDGCLKMLMEN